MLLPSRIQTVFQLLSTSGSTCSEADAARTPASSSSTTIRGIATETQRSGKTVTAAIQRSGRLPSTIAVPTLHLSEPAATAVGLQSETGTGTSSLAQSHGHTQFSLDHVKSLFETVTGLAANSNLSDDEVVMVGTTLFEMMEFSEWLWESLETNDGLPLLDLGFQAFLRMVSVFIRAELSDESDDIADDETLLLTRAFALGSFEDEETQLVVVGLGNCRCWTSLRWVPVDGGYRCGCGRGHRIYSGEVQRSMKALHDRPESLRFSRDVRRCGISALVVLKRMGLLKRRLDRWGDLKSMEPPRRTKFLTSTDIKKGALLVLQMLRLPSAMESEPDYILAAISVYFPGTFARTRKFKVMKTDILDPMAHVLELWIEAVEKREFASDRK